MATERSSTSLAEVLVPIKGFERAKARLTEVLSDEERTRLARAWAETVVRAAAPLPVTVLFEDDDVAAWALEQGAAVMRCTGQGLNSAVSEGVAHLMQRGVEVAVIAHGDLPLATRLDHLVGGINEVTLVPDRHGDGTNVLVVPTGAGYEFAYGPGSFARHLDEADRLGLEVRILLDPTLAWDVDEPADLELPESIS